MTNYDTEKFHEEVETILFGFKEDKNTTLELIASNPKYYLDIISNYKKNRTGEDIYLPYLLNIKEFRDKTGLKIKFKINDNDRWTSIGYDDNIPDDIVYKTFSEKIILLLQTPTTDNREHIINEIKNEIKNNEQMPIPIPLINQGNQDDISKIAKFFKVDVNDNTNVNTNINHDKFYINKINIENMKSENIESRKCFDDRFDKLYKKLLELKSKCPDEDLKFYDLYLKRMVFNHLINKYSEEFKELNMKPWKNL